VVVSAYSDMENIRTAMNRGAFDFLTKPIDFGGPVLEAAVSSQPVGQQALSTLTVTTTQASGEGGGISSDGTPTVENSGSIIGNTAPGVSVAEDVDNLDALYVDSTGLNGILDRGVA
jgi:hypothetical protein